MELRTIPNLRVMTDTDLRKLAAEGGDFGGAAAYVLDLRRELAGFVRREPVPTCGARQGELRCDRVRHGDDQMHVDFVMDQAFTGDDRRGSDRGDRHRTALDMNLAGTMFTNRD